MSPDTYKIEKSIGDNSQVLFFLSDGDLSKVPMMLDVDKKTVEDFMLLKRTKELNLLYVRIEEMQQLENTKNGR
jgi:hypothetical protein